LQDTRAERAEHHSDHDRHLARRRRRFRRQYAREDSVSRFARGTRIFSNAHAHNVVTLPSHASILTGSNPDVLNAYGVALADEGRPAEAVRQFEGVLSVDPNNSPALQNLGIVALRGDDVQRAGEYLNRALALNPRLPLALNSLGVVRARGGDPAGAVELWRRAVALDPRQYDALFNIAAVESKAGHREEAGRALTQFVRTAPPSRYARDIVAARQALAELR
jgi:Tfp pilus assembly protein PilF